MADEAGAVETLPEGVEPLSLDGDMTPVERERTLFVAEDPAGGPYYRYDPGKDEFVEREAITADFLSDVAETSDPETGSIVNELGDVDYSAQMAIGHEENKRFLHAANLPSAGDTKRVLFDRDSGKLTIRQSMPTQVAKMIDAGMFPKVSARFYERYPGVNKPALAHVAMLGTMPPVAKNLGPWSPALFSDNAESATASAKAAGLIVFDMTKGDLVLDFAEVAPAELRTRIMEKVQADAEQSLEFVSVDLANAAGVTPEEINRFLAGETDEIADAAKKALMRFAGIPTMDAAAATTEDGDAGDDGDDDGGEGAPPPAAADEGSESEEEEPDDKEKDMAEGKKQKKGAKPTKAAKPEMIEVPAKDFAELNKKVNDLSFIVGAQKKKAKGRDNDHAKLMGEVAEQRRLGRKERILAFAELMHSTGRLPGPARKKFVADHLELVGPEGTRCRDFAETDEKDDLQREMDFIEKIAPTAVDTRGGFVSAGTAGPEAVDFAEMDTELADYRQYKAEAKAAGQPTDLTFRTFAEANGHDAEVVESFCREKKIDHPNIKDGNEDK